MEFIVFAEICKAVGTAQWVIWFCYFLVALDFLLGLLKAYLRDKE